MNRHRIIRDLRIRFQRHFTLYLSDDETLYYIKELARPGDMWLEVEAHEGYAPEEVKKASEGFFSPSVVEIKHNDGRVWWRKVYPFNMWKIRAYRNLTKKVHRNDDLWADWLSVADGNYP